MLMQDITVLYNFVQFLMLCKILFRKDLKEVKTLTGRRESTARRKEYEQRQPFEIKYRCAVSDTTSNITPFNMGYLNNKCSYCSALYFSCENNSAGYFGNRCVILN